MKTSKILLKILVVLVLAIALLIPSTFSWYNHDGEQSGKEMRYFRSKLPVSAGNVTAETRKYFMDDEKRPGVGSANNVYYDQKGNKEYNGDSLTAGNITRDRTQYYGTTFTNTGTSPAYVNLYLNNFSNSTNAYIGTLQPSLTQKGISSSVHLTNKNFIRVYFQVKSVNNWSATGATTYLVYKTKAGTEGYITAAGNIDLTDADASRILSNIATAYFDLPKDTTEFFFATDANNSGFNTETKTTTIPWYRTKTITNVQAETGYYLTGSTDDTTWNAQYVAFNIPGGVSIKTAFDKLTINNGQHAYVTLNEGNNYTGKSVSYSVTAGSGITVDANTGLISSSNSVLDDSSFATITATVTGSLGDTATAETTVFNPPAISAVPVALNVKVPAQTSETIEGRTVTTPGKAEVVWYIQNSGTGPVSFDNIYFTK